MNRILLFSHKSDIDGMGSVILSKLAFSNFDYILCEGPNDLETKFRNMLNQNYFDNYDKIFITDLSLERPSIDLVNESVIKEKLLIFDHHQGAIDNGLDKYSFSTIMEKDENGNKTCGTDLFYRYLKNNNLICKNECIEEFVELTRLEDSWIWEEYGEFGLKAHDLAIYFNIVGIDNYIDNIYNKLKNENIDFTSEELNLISDKKKNILRVIKKALDEAESFIDEFNNKYIICYCDYEYRNDLPNYIINNGNKDNYKYMIIVAFDKALYGQKSYRRIDKDIDINAIAMAHGGGGHKGSAGVLITKEQKEYALKLNKRDGLKYLADSSYKK